MISHILLYLTMNNYCHAERKSILYLHYLVENFRVLFSLTFNTLTADVESILTANFKDDAFLGFAIQTSVSAVAILVRW